MTFNTRGERRGQNSERNVDVALDTAKAIFETIKTIPDGAVALKIQEVGEESVWDYFINKYMWMKGYREFALPAKGTRRRFFPKGRGGKALGGPVVNVSELANSRAKFS